MVRATSCRASVPDWKWTRPEWEAGFNHAPNCGPYSGNERTLVCSRAIRECSHSVSRFNLISSPQFAGILGFLAGDEWNRESIKWLSGSDYCSVFRKRFGFSGDDDDSWFCHDWWMNGSFFKAIDDDWIIPIKCGCSQFKLNFPN